MLQTLLNSIASDEQREQEAARTRYAQLLIEDHDGNAVELKKLMATLGKTSQDVRADYMAALEWRRLKGVIADGTGLAEKQEKAQKAVADHMEKIQRIQGELRIAHQKLVLEQTDIAGRYLAAQRAVEAMNKLRDARRDLFGDQPAATAAGL